MLVEPGHDSANEHASFILTLLRILSYILNILILNMNTIIEEYLGA